MAAISPAIALGKVQIVRPIAISGKVQARATATSDRAQRPTARIGTDLTPTVRIDLGNSRQVAEPTTVQASQAPSVIMALVGMLAPRRSAAMPAWAAAAAVPEPSLAVVPESKVAASAPGAVAAPGCNAAAEVEVAEVAAVADLSKPSPFLVKGLRKCIAQL
ncbi:hypothetical protein C7476_1572 [Phyllobacterium bourgognense]|uniref:Uncharacterized protein n=1 Tax=Phyllobacterium bourgognense TaxID=314236 RepID=A0A368Y9X8_9HYPH|nr:hypothetical protein C7476_1572 [Phyllobacterium bourgognense]